MDRVELDTRVRVRFGDEDGDGAGAGGLRIADWALTN
jgi:hypothetical protein